MKRSALRSVALIGTYVPRMCGIATFTKDLHDALCVEAEDLDCLVLGLDDTPDGYDYPEEVRFQIRDNKQRDYFLAADYLHINQVDAAIVQHEFGIYGGESGMLVLDFIRRLQMPAITALHTVLSEPTAPQREVMRGIAELSDRIVVLSSSARAILESCYGIDAERIAVIPHGIPDVPFVDPAFYKDHFGLENRTVLLTFGLISPGKGIETVIKALPAVVERHPEVIYIVLGATHPNVFRKEGNAYIASLERLAAKLRVRDHVLFHNRYVSFEELRRYLGCADLYVTPYVNREQIVSGTLAYAMGTGKTVLSTPYRFAEEMLADEKGVLFPFGDHQALARSLNDLLDDGGKRAAMRKRAYMSCRPMVWKEIARRYIALANEVVEERANRPRPLGLAGDQPSMLDGIPEINLAHMSLLTDDTGILQHAVYTVPDREHGYCTDDNARALIASLRYYALMRDDSILPLAKKYLSFLHFAYQQDTGRFRNFLSYRREWTDKAPSDDASGRALWALGSVVSLAPTDALVSFACRLFSDASKAAVEFTSPRAWAFALIGMGSYLQKFSGDSNVRRVQLLLAKRLMECFRAVSGDGWMWCEDIVTYANAMIPNALILSGRSLGDTEMTDQGMSSLAWLVDLQLTPEGTVSLIGNAGWLRRDGSRARFDQQPIDAMAMTEACIAAFRHSADPVWRERAGQFIGWFLGNNETQSVLYDSVTGGCRDGLQPNGPNLNEGAESTLAWLIGLLGFHQLEREMGMTYTARRGSRPAAKTAVNE